MYDGDGNLYDSARIIRKYFPTARPQNRWHRFYPFSYNAEDYCPFSFFCNYWSGITIPKHPLAIAGLRTHRMKCAYFRRVDPERIVNYYLRVRSEELAAERIRLYFPVWLDEFEEGTIDGFSRLEANRLAVLDEICHGNAREIVRRYAAAFTEVTLKTREFGGRIDIIFREEQPDCLVADWKDGYAKPFTKSGNRGASYCADDLKIPVQNQVNIYGILVDEVKVIDKFGGKRYRIESDDFAVIYPRHEIVVRDVYSSLLQQNIADKSEEMLEMINSWQFPMRASEKWCLWDNKNYQCDWFKPVCKGVMENEMDMIFDEPSVEDYSMIEVPA